MGNPHPLCFCCNYERRYVEERSAQAADQAEIGRVFAVGVGVGLVLHHENDETQKELSSHLCERHRSAMHEPHNPLSSGTIMNRLVRGSFPL